MPTTTWRSAAPRAALFAAASIGLFALGQAAAVAAPLVGSVAVTASETAGVGDTVEVTIALPGLTDVYAYELKVDVDPGLVTYVDGSVTGPAGGFDDASQDGEVIHVVHSRLGTSPSLSGDATASIDLVAVGSGVASIDISSLVLVDESGETTTIADPAGTTVTIAAPPVTDEPADGEIDSPAGDGADAGGDTATAGTGTPSTEADALATTGVEALPFLGFGALAVVAGGALLAIRGAKQRKAVSR